MNATRTLCPSAISPPTVDELSESTSPFLIFCPKETIGRWWNAVTSFVFMKLTSVYSFFFLCHSARRFSARRRPQSCRLLPRRRRARSLCRTPSMPVATSGGHGMMHGTACFCMFEPMSARFASSCSRNGMRDVATENGWFEATSIKVDFLFAHKADLARFVFRAHLDEIIRKEAVILPSWRRERCCTLFFKRVQIHYLLGDFPFETLLYGGFDKAEIVHSRVDGETKIRPMLWPSGV